MSKHMLTLCKSTKKFRYLDKVTEKQRKNELLKRENDENENKTTKKIASNKSWSKNKLRHDKKQKRKEYKERKRKLKEETILNDQELAELEDDARLVKKLKKGKVHILLLECRVE